MGVRGAKYVEEAVVAMFVDSEVNRGGGWPWPVR